MQFNRSVLFQTVNIVGFIVTLIVNGLAGSTTLLNGVTSGEISDLYPTFVTPAGFTFAIWSIIYALLLLFVVYQALPKNKDQPFLNKIGLFFGLSSLFNIIWLFLWHYNFITISLVFMIGLLTSLVFIYLRLDIGKSNISLKERFFVQLPFSVYLGWISIATIANLSVTLTIINWDGFGIQATTWAVIIIVVAVILSLIMLISKKDVAFNLVVIWALFGILSKQSEQENIVLTSEVAIIILAIFVVIIGIYSWIKR